MAWLFACRILPLCLCTLFMLALVCLVLLRIDAEQGIYQEIQEHYPDPSLASTELPGKHYHMLAYIQYLLPYLILASLSRDCIKLNPKYCMAFTFKPHRSLFLHPMSHYYRSCLSHASRRTACVGFVRVWWITRYLKQLNLSSNGITNESGTGEQYLLFGFSCSLVSRRTPSTWFLFLDYSRYPHPGGLWDPPEQSLIPSYFLGPQTSLSFYLLSCTYAMLYCFI
jgi:hypothetical protein